MCQKQKGKMYDPEAPTFKILHAIGAVCNNSKFLVTEEDPTLVAEGWVKDDYNMLDVTCSSDASRLAWSGSAAHQGRRRVQGRQPKGL